MRKSGEIDVEIDNHMTVADRKQRADEDDQFDREHHVDQQHHENGHHKTKVPFKKTRHRQHTREAKRHGASCRRPGMSGRKLGSTSLKPMADPDAQSG
jgi:hypothetical protein